MFIPKTGGTAYIQPSPYRITIALTNVVGTVSINQRGDGPDDWFPYVADGEEMILDADNTMRSIYAPCKLQIIAVGTGVRVHDPETEIYSKP